MSEANERLATALADRYRIEQELGQGGMATVYLAEDLKHKRKVALKVLKPELAAVLGAERFVQEITTTASLQHPHILPLFDSGTADGFLFYVMPFIDGETLRDKLDRETQLGINEAVRITTEVADALHYAHQQGVIHRDIKPENILLQNGRAMVADFGIALAVSAAAGGRMTETGLSLGTPHYMSPEQATAEKDLSARSDVYSLGSVLYEMLTGDPPHTASSAQQIIMKIVTEEAAPVTKARKSVPPNIAAAVAQSLEKLPADRFASAAEFAAALQNPTFATTAIGSGAAGAAVPPFRRSALTAILATTTVLFAALAGWAWLASEAAPPAVPFHASLSDTLIPLPSGIAISPDGRLIIVAVSIRDGAQLFARAADDDLFRLIPGTEGAVSPTFSPDGRTIGFHQAQAGQGQWSLRRIPVEGGVAQTIADSVAFSDWGADGTIVVIRSEGLYRIPPEGGSPELILSSDTLAINSPSLLPDGSGVLFTDDEVVSGRGLLLDFATREVSVLLERALNPKYVASGHIVYQAPPPSRIVMAVPFDLAARRITGPPVAVLSQVWRLAGTSHWVASRTGTLVYVRSPNVEATERLAWVDMTGDATLLPLQVQDMENPRVSPDGRRIAFIDFNGQAASLYDVSTGATTRLGAYVSFAWSADSRVLYASAAQGSRNATVRVNMDGTGAIDTLRRDDGEVFGVTPDGTRLVLQRGTGSRGSDIDILRIDGETPELVPYLRANWNERQPALSPDGRWLAYTSDETGGNGIYVRAFPEPGPPVRVSESGGVGAAWAPDGSGIFYAGPDSMIRAGIAVGRDGLEVRSRRGVFAHSGFEVTTAAFFQALGFPRRYDVHPGGDRLLMVRSLEETFDLGVPIRIVTNWFEEVRQRAREGGTP
jgi:Tol biopolymer transport system component/tRNA A-37 threonylcarbamoyl transferase component Bud32